MIVTVKLPKVGEMTEDAEVVEWYLQVGDRVAEGQPLVAVETDKAVVDIPSPVAGTVVEIVAEVGAVVDVGGPLVRLEVTR